MDSTFKETNFILRAGDNPNTNDIPACLCKDQVTGMDFIFAKFKLSPDGTRLATTVANGIQSVYRL